MRSDSLEFLTALIDAPSPSGYEQPAAAVFRDYVSKWADDVTTDVMGSVSARLAGTGDGPSVMLAGHMDEIGFMVRQITKEGFLKFLPLGGWFDQVLLGQRVLIKTSKGDVTGVLGARPPHLLSPEERTKVVTRKDMYIDIGATSEAEVLQAGVQLGDPIVPCAGSPWASWWEGCGSGAPGGVRSWSSWPSRWRCSSTPSGCSLPGSSSSMWIPGWAKG